VAGRGRRQGCCDGAWEDCQGVRPEKLTWPIPQSLVAGHALAPPCSTLRHPGALACRRWGIAPHVRGRACGRQPATAGLLHACVLPCSHAAKQPRRAKAAVGKHARLISWACPPSGPCTSHSHHASLAGLPQALKEHQWEGVRFVWDSLVVDFEGDDDLAGGCILAHHMGLGKVCGLAGRLCSRYMMHHKALMAP
jgi:hypothetical protein